MARPRNEISLYNYEDMGDGVSTIDDVISSIGTQVSNTNPTVENLIAIGTLNPTQISAITGTPVGQVISIAASTAPLGQAVQLGDTYVNPSYEIRGSGEDQQIVGINSISTSKVDGSDANQVQQFTPSGNPIGAGNQVLSTNNVSLDNVISQIQTPTVKTQEQIATEAGFPSLSSYSLFNGNFDAYNTAKGLGESAIKMAVKRADTDLRYDVNNDGKVTSADGLLLSKGTPLRTDIDMSGATVKAADTQTATQETNQTQSNNQVATQPTIQAKAPSTGDTIRSMIDSNAFASGQAVLVDGTYYQPVYNSSGSGETFEQGPLQNVIVYKEGENKVGGDVNWYSPSGEFQQLTKQQEVNATRDFMDFALKAGSLFGVPAGLGEALGIVDAAGVVTNVGQAVGQGLLTTGTQLGSGESLGDALTAGLITGGLSIGGSLLKDVATSTLGDVIGDTGQAAIGQVSTGQVASTVADTAAATDLAQNLVNSGVSTSEVSQLLNSVGFDQGVTNAAVNNVVTLNQVVNAIGSDTGVATGSTATDTTGVSTGTSQVGDVSAATNLAQNLVDSGLSTSQVTQLLDSVGFDQGVTNAAVNNVLTTTDVVNVIAGNQTGAVGTDTITGGAGTEITGSTGTGITGTSSGLGITGDATGEGISVGGGLTGTGILTDSTLGTELLGTGTGVAGLTGTGLLTGSTLGTDLLGTTSTTGLTGTGVLTGSTLGTDLLGTGANTAATVGGVTGLTNAANVGTGAVSTGVTTGLTGLGSDALSTGVNPSGAGTGVSTGTSVVAPKTYTMAEIAEMARLGLLGAGILGAGAAASSGPTQYDIVPVPADWKSPVYQKDLPVNTGAMTTLPAIDFGTRDLLKGTQWQKLLDPNYGKIPEQRQFSQPSDMSYSRLMSILGTGRDVMPSQGLTINDVISGIQNQYGQTR